MRRDFGRGSSQVRGSGMPWGRAGWPTGSRGTQFPWELVLGTFAGASLLLTIALTAAGSGAPAAVLAFVGAVLTSLAAVLAWRRTGGISLRRRDGHDASRQPRGSSRGGDTGSFGRTRTGEDGATVDVATIPDFRTRLSGRTQAPQSPLGPHSPRQNPTAGSSINPSSGSGTGVGSAKPGPPRLVGDEITGLDMSTRDRRNVDEGTTAAREWAGGDGVGGEVLADPGLDLAVRELREVVGSSASAVLMRRGRRLFAVASSGDWAEARSRRASGARAEDRGSVAWSAVAQSGNAPPEFPVDDGFAELLTRVGRAMPVERWQTVQDIPEGLLPVVGLADTGVAVVVPCAHRGEFLALWVIGSREGARRYTDRELTALEGGVERNIPLLVSRLRVD